MYFQSPREALEGTAWKPHGGQIQPSFLSPPLLIVFFLPLCLPLFILSPLPSLHLSLPPSLSLSLSLFLSSLAQQGLIVRLMLFRPLPKTSYQPVAAIQKRVLSGTY